MSTIAEEIRRLRESYSQSIDPLVINANNEGELLSKFSEMADYITSDGDDKGCVGFCSVEFSYYETPGDPTTEIGGNMTVPIGTIYMAETYDTNEMIVLSGGCISGDGGHNTIAIVLNNTAHFGAVLEVTINGRALDLDAPDTPSGFNLNSVDLLLCPPIDVDFLQN